MRWKHLFMSLIYIAVASCGIAQAQDMKKGSIGDNIKSKNGQSDSEQTLSEEIAQIKLRLNAEERARHFDSVWKRKKYWKLGFANPNIERTDGTAMAWKTEFAVFLQRGKTAYLHSKPICGMVKFGIDYGFMNISYAKLKLNEITLSAPPSSTPETSPGSNPDGFDEIVSKDPDGSVPGMLGLDLGMHKIEYGIHIGPSISVNPWNHLIVAAYFHFEPTASFIIENDMFSYGFNYAMSGGISVSYKAISIGAEGLWSTIKYKQASFDEEDESEDEGGIFKTEEFKLKQKGPRFYIAVKF